MRGEFVDVGGVRLYYYAAGTRGGGDPIVLVHGSFGDHTAWAIPVEELRTDGTLAEISEKYFGEDVTQ